LLERRRQRRILYVERDEADIDLTRTALAAAARHLTLEIVSSGREALQRAQANGVDLVPADLRRSDMSGLNLRRESRHRGLQVPCIVTTGKGDESAAVAALKLGAYDYIVKR